MKHGFLMSQLNSAQEVTSQFRLPECVIINDCTLREGEQFSALNVDEKIMLARELDDLAVQQIQGGCPGRSEIDLNAIKGMKKGGIRAKIEALVVAFGTGLPWKTHIDAAIASEADLVNIVFPSSDVFLENVLRMSREAMLDVVVCAVEYAKEHGFHTTFSPLDSTRTDLDFLRTLFAAVVDAGADRLCVCDTVGVISPPAMRFLVETVKRAVKVPIGVHCHNDVGLALANSLAALESGAEIVDATINGLGERAGTTSLDELVVALKVFYGRDLGIRTERLYEVSNLAGRLFRFPPALNKPLVGGRAFAHSTDTHVQAMVTFPFAIEGIEPQMVGNRRNILISKYSGPYVIKAKAEELGLSIPADKIEGITHVVRKMAIEEKTGLTDEGFMRVVTKAICA